MAQRKETKRTIRARDLKPKKDVKGGRVPPGGHAGNRPGRGDGPQLMKRTDG